MKTREFTQVRQTFKKPESLFSPPVSLQLQSDIQIQNVLAFLLPCGFTQLSG